MKQSVSAIFLVITYLGVIFHGMIPHHHQKEELHFQSECMTHEGEQELDSEFHCVLGDISTLDEHHTCPHHFHICFAPEFDFNRVEFSKKLTKKNLSSGIGISEIRFYVNNLFSNHPISFLEVNKELHIQGVSQLRAPPVSA